MPIEGPVVSRATEGEFRPVDYAVMGHVFESQAELGKLCDEKVYQADLAARLAEAGMRARREVPVRVSCGDFLKMYWIDLLVEESFVYELKAVPELAGRHEAQALHYMMLANAARGKVLNLRASKVQARFVNAPLDIGVRRQWRVAADRFSEGGRMIRARMAEMLDDWGACLDLALYSEALVHFCGGEERVCVMEPMLRGSVRLGRQRFHLAADGEAFKVTGFKSDLKGHEAHLRRMLGLSSLRCMHWVNLDGRDVSFVTIER